jgi:hypothetical protein
LKIVTANGTRLEPVTADRVDACLNDLAKQGRGTLKKKKDRRWAQHAQQLPHRSQKLLPVVRAHQSPA